MSGTWNGGESKMPYKDPKRKMEIYYWRKENNICVACGKKQSLENRTHCFECNEKAKEYARENQIWRKQHGICVVCGKSRAEKYHVICRECRKKQKEYYAKRVKR